MNDEKGRHYIPIVGSKYHFGIWENGLCNMMTYRIMDKADLSMNVAVSGGDIRHRGSEPQTSG
jgi:hypothetical protein